MIASPTGRRFETIALGLAVGLVLADSSVVILALPDVLDQFHVSIQHVAWVLILFNLVLGTAALPAAFAARRLGAARVCSFGLVVFAAASLLCATASHFEWLLVGRGIQAIGGACAVCAALELLAARFDSDAGAAPFWTASGAIGAAAGPAIGGALTDLISWRAIFAVQVPLAVIALVFTMRAKAGRASDGAVHRPSISSNLALGLLSASLTAALFLIVLLLINGWGLTPLGAAVVVTAMPVTAAITYRVLPKAPSPAIEAASGLILVAGGLAALAVLPGKGWWWTLPPQVLIGAGLAMALGALTRLALRGRTPLAIHGGWTIAARHAGVVVGLLLLTPVFTHDLHAQETAAQNAGTQLVINAPLSLTTKIGLGSRLQDTIGSGSPSRPPDIHPAFAPLGNTGDAPRLEAAIQDQIDRAVTHAFSRSFLFASLFALAALVPLGVRRLQ
jgi:MFS family permease